MDSETTSQAAPAPPEPRRQRALETRLLAAGQMLAERRVFGMLWLDADLRVSSKIGALVDFVPLAAPVTETILPLVGLEDDIRALRHHPEQALDLPAVSIITCAARTPRLNLTLFWHASEDSYLMVVSQAISRSDLEAELSVQIRARLMAEAELKRASIQLAHANTELTRANRDLEDFASIISHDLSSAMRSIMDLTHELAATATIGPTHTISATIGELQAQVRRLSVMLRDLHEYSSLGRKQDALAEVDTSALIQSIVRALPRHPQFDVRIAGTWPALITLKAPLDLVLRNLLANALKHHDRASGTVTVTCAPETHALVITVEDDGPGISPLHREAVFLPFRTLGSPSSGTGMGLSFVKRSVETVGGTLELISDPDVRRGALFRITWPRQLNALSQSDSPANPDE